MSNLDFVLCHLDFSCPNILWEEGKPPCLLDWGWAGYYPRFFEKRSHDIVGRAEDGNIVADKQLSKTEHVQSQLLLKAWGNDMHFCL